MNVFEIINRNYETFLTKPNKYSIFDNGDIIPKNRKCEHTNEAQTRVVWAFSNFVKNSENNNLQKVNYPFVKVFGQNFYQNCLCNTYKFSEKKRSRKRNNVAIE